MRPSKRQPDELRNIRITRRYTRHAEGAVLIECRRHQSALHRQRRGQGAAVPEGQRPGLADRRIRHAAARHPHAHRPRGGARQAVGPHAGNPAPDRPRVARGRRPGGARRAHAARSIATCCRPTAARARRHHRRVGRRSRCGRHLLGSKCVAAVARARFRRGGFGRHRTAACRCSISITPRIPPATPT